MLAFLVLNCFIFLRNETFWKNERMLIRRKDLGCIGVVLVDQVVSAYVLSFGLTLILIGLDYQQAFAQVFEHLLVVNLFEIALGVELFQLREILLALQG
jgi:hypothetical protein